MAKYIGTKCIVCGDVFKEGDDVVVCPDCGTPYHRECWNRENKCVNTALHENGGSWQPEYPKGDEPQYTGEALRCIRCGEENAPGAMFCVKCGMPLTQGRNDSRPFNDPAGNDPQPNANGYFDYSQPDQQNMGNGFGQGFDRNPQFGGFGMPVQQIKLTEDSDLNGIRLGDFFDYAGRRSLSVMASFVKFAKTGAKTSLNIVAFFFPQYYFFYRKMYKEGLLFMLLWFICFIPTLILYGQTGMSGMVLFHMPFSLESKAFLTVYNITQLVMSVGGIVAGFYANYWYYNKARRDITQIRSEESDDENEVRRRIVSTGGTSWAKVIVSLTVAAVLSLGFLLILSALF